MRTAFIGGGPGCKAIIEMANSQTFRSFKPDIVGVMDIDPNSVGFQYAKSLGIPVYTKMADVMMIDDLEVLVELVGSYDVLDEIYQHLPSGVRVIDHGMAQIFWELEEAGRRFDQIINSAHGHITLKDVHGKYLMVNKRAAEFFGIEQIEFLGKTSHELLPKNIADMVCAAEQEIIETRTHRTFNDDFECEGHELSFVTERFPILDYQGNIIEICGISRDITDAKRMREELIRSVKMATLGQLAAGVAHEINNPLTGILSFAENIKEDLNLSDPIYADIDIIIRESLRCRRIVRDLLDFSRLSKPHIEWLSMNDIVGRVIALVGKQAAFHDIIISFNAEVDLPNVEMDPTQAQQVVLNLIINAQEAVKGKGCINIATRTNRERHVVILEIADDGCGIPSSDINRIFDPFFSTKGSHGNGLGLSAVSRIVNSHDGDIFVESEINRGSVFRIEIPYERQCRKRENSR